MTRIEKISYLEDIKAGKKPTFPIITEKEKEVIGIILDNANIEDFCSPDGFRQAGISEDHINVWIRFFGEKWCS